MKITAVRHGQTEGNVAHIVQSRTGGVLTDLGITQARATAVKLKDEHFDIVYCSDMQRCLDTASYIMKYHQETPLVITEDLRELSKGIYEGMQWEDMPDFATLENQLDKRTPEGESWLDVDERLRAFLNSVHKEHKQESVLFVSHNGPMKVLASILNNKPLSISVKEEFENGSYGLWNMNDPVTSNPVR